MYGDFLEQNGNLGKFDKILMNPPFANGADIKHIMHARQFLNPGGVIIAICANGPRQQDALKPIADSFTPLLPGSFQESGTNVNAALVIINPKPMKNKNGFIIDQRGNNFLLRRTFNAAKHPPGSDERKILNADPVTSEYMTSHKFMVRREAIMSDGRQNPAQLYHDKTFVTLKEAIIDFSTIKP